MSLGKKSWDESPHFVVTREHSKYTIRALHALMLPVLSVPWATRGQQHRRTAALNTRHSRLPSPCQHWPPCRVSSHDGSTFRLSPSSIAGEWRTRRPDATTWPEKCTLGRIDPGTWYKTYLIFSILDIWVTRVIRGAGREFCQRRVDHTHSRPATVNGHSRQSLSLTGYPLEILDGTQWRANWS